MSRTPAQKALVSGMNISVRKGQVDCYLNFADDSRRGVGKDGLQPGNPERRLAGASEWSAAVRRILPSISKPSAAWGRRDPHASLRLFWRDYLPLSAIAQVNFPATGRLLHIEFLVGRFEQLLYRCATWRVRGDPDAQRQSRLFRAAL